MTNDEITESLVPFLGQQAILLSKLHTRYLISCAEDGLDTRVFIDFYFQIVLRRLTLLPNRK